VEQLQWVNQKGHTPSPQGHMLCCLILRIFSWWVNEATLGGPLGKPSVSLQHPASVPEQGIGAAPFLPAMAHMGPGPRIIMSAQHCQDWGSSWPTRRISADALETFWK